MAKEDIVVDRRLRILIIREDHDCPLSTTTMAEKESYTTAVYDPVENVTQKWLQFGYSIGPVFYTFA